jgi:hypothetical protein
MIFRGTPGAPFVKIGTVTLTVQRTFHDAGFQTASWWRDVDCQPQTVDLLSNGYYVKWQFEGVITEDFFGSSYGDMPIGTYDRTKNAGKAASKHVHSYAFSWAERQYHGEPTDGIIYELDAEYGVDCAPYQHDPSKTGYFLTTTKEA